jgi:hypothetical protein
MYRSQDMVDFFIYEARITISGRVVVITSQLDIGIEITADANYAVSRDPPASRCLPEWTKRGTQALQCRRHGHSE